MKKQGPVGPAPSRVLPPAQRAVLRLLTDSGPGTVEELADRLDVHVNTVRGHIDALLGDGRVVRRKRPAPGRGRPTWVYAAAPVGLEYVSLAETLIRVLAAAAVPAELLADQGRAWGAELAERITGAADADRALRDLLTLQGFAPRHRDDDLVLTRCPLVELARDHRDVVCGLHAAMINGALRHWRADAGPARLEPFSDPDGCRVRRG